MMSCSLSSTTLREMIDLPRVTLQVLRGSCLVRIARLYCGRLDVPWGRHIVSLMFAPSTTHPHPTEPPVLFTHSGWSQQHIGEIEMSSLGRCGDPKEDFRKLL